MQQVNGYHRPSTLSEALLLLGGPTARPLAGGTSLRHQPGGEPIDVVDLQSLGLDAITNTSDSGPNAAARISIGAMARLQALVDNELVPAVISDAAKAEEPSTLRTLATVGGAVARPASDSLLVTALLAYDATVELVEADDSRRMVPLAEVLKSGVGSQQLITLVSVAADGEGAVAQTGRTPADTPIVAAVARRGTDGTITIAVSGLADTPILVASDDPAELAATNPPSDFRGSSRYRSTLAQVLTTRVTKELS